MAPAQLRMLWTCTDQVYCQGKPMSALAAEPGGSAPRRDRRQVPAPAEGGLEGAVALMCEPHMHMRSTCRSCPAHGPLRPSWPGLGPGRGLVPRHPPAARAGLLRSCAGASLQVAFGRHLKSLHLLSLSAHNMMMRATGSCGGSCGIVIGRKGLCWCLIAALHEQALTVMRVGGMLLPSSCICTWPSARYPWYIVAFTSVN